GALALMIFGFGKGVYEGFYDIKPKTQRTPGVQVVQVEENIHLDPNVTYSQLQERIRTSEKDSDQSLVGTGALFFEEGLKENGRNFLETMYDGASWLVGSVVDFTSGLGKGFINLFVDHGSEIVTGRAPARYERDPASLVDIVVPQVSRTVSFEPPTQENDAFAKAHRETQLVYAIHGMGHYLKTGTYDHLNSDGVFVALRDKDPITSMKMFGLDDLWEYKRTLRDVKSPFALDWNERSALTTDQVVDRIVSSVKQEMTYTKDILDGLGLEMSKLVRNNMQVYLEKKMGVCLDFAQVAAYSLRESGVPSRVVVGAVGDVGHAWIEWYSTEKDMWVPVEVTDPKKTNDPPYWPVALGLLGIGGVIFGRHRIKRSLRKRYRLDSNLFSDDELSREYDLLSLNMSELKFFEQRLFGRKGHSSTLGFNKEAMKKFKKTMIREHLPDYIQALMSKPIVYAHNYGAPLSMFDLVEIGEREGEILYSNENTSTTPHYTQKRIPVLDMGSLTSTTQSFVRGCVESVLGYKLASVDQDSHFHIFEDERELSEPERSLVDRVEGVLALDRKIKRKTKAVKPGKFDYHIRNSTPRLAKYQSGTLYLNMNHPLIVGLGNGNPTPIDKLAIDVVLDVSTDDGLVNPGSKYFAKLGKHTQNAALN
ncbi:transglutaminase domain-containing protein, partial [Candidatus Woesearchaeota archaeon]|nr:transglutaminase domain-containing protein [Candidatus Woesearchaeota archaeon]